MGQYFRQGRAGSKINYKFTCVKAATLCCRSHATAESDMGNQIFYIDRHRVGSENSKSWAMQRFKVDSGYSPKRVIKYSYRICKLKDMDAQNEADKNESNLQSTKANLTASQEKLAASNAAVEQVQKEMAALTAKLQSDQAAVEAQHAQVEEAQTLLTNSQNASGLKC